MGIDDFCGGEFWNLSLTWYTDDPQFTRCFEKTALVWFPCLFLWILSPLEYYFLSTSKTRNVPWNWINITKLGITGALIVVLAADLATIFQAVSNEQVVYDVDFYTPLIKALTIAFSGVLVYYNRKYGMHTSGLLFIFWFLLVLCGIPQLRTEIRNSQNDDVHPDFYGAHLTYIIYWVLIAVMFLLNCLADKQPLERMYEKQQNPLPEKSASYLSRLVFAWFDPLVLLGYKKPLEQTDLWDIAPENSAKEIVPVFEKHWFKSVENAKKKNKNASFLPSLFKTFGTMFMVGAFFRFVTDVMIFVSPNILGYLINYVSQKQEFWKGILYAVLLFVSATFQSLLSQQFMNLNLIVSMRIRTSIISLIYKKALIISNAARKQSTVGEIVNLMSVDAQRFGDVGNTINILWSAPLQIGLATYFLWQELGPSTLAGLAVLLLLFPINGVVARISKKLFMKNMKNKDERVKMMNEILSGIRVLKLYAWEESFEKQVLKVRDRELKVMKQSRYLHAVTSFVMNITPFMVALASFTTFIFVDENNILDASKAFVSISLFNIIRGPLLQLPMIITNLLEMFVSVKRLNTFFNAEEINPENVYHAPNKEYPVTVERGTFSWGTDPTIKDINIKIQTKTLAAIVGPVGAGKSSLLSALLGEMVKITGKVNTYGSIAYVPQQAWIQNATLMDNILFGKPYDKKRYDTIINACALKSDFEILPAGDQTEIGEKGINLSGGQKQRVSLARAVYCDADVYFLDDPLSAVDSHVGKHIFDYVIGPKGLLKNKTKLLVTHGVTYLPQTDQIIVLKDGFVSENGTYQQLLQKKGDFADFLLQHISSGDVDDAELEELKDQLADTPMVEEIQRRLSRQNSRVSVTLSDSAGSDLQSTDSLNRKPSREGSMKPKSGGPGGPGVRGGPGGPGGTGVKGGKMNRGQRLIEKEKAEEGNVKLAVYKYYLENVGFNMIFFLFLVQVISQGFGVGSNAWLGKWTDDDELYVDGVINTFKRDMYLGVYGAIGFGQAVTVILYNVIYAIATIAAASKIHKCLLENTLRLPTHFFDTTPIGRILARFSSDMNGVDGMLPMTFQMVLSNGIRVISTLVVISYSTPLFVTVIVPLFIVYYLIQRFYIATSRQLRRLVSITRSPIYTHFGETITGIQTIRAYGQQERFNLESHKRIDQNQVSFYPEMTAGRWLAIRLELIGNLIIFFSAMFAVLAKDLSPALVGLSVSYSLQITQTLKWLVHMASNVETSIVAVERIKEYQETKQEAPWEKPDKLKKSWPENGTVEFINYGVRYREGLDLVLKDFNIRIEAGEKVGIVGRTGAGKSSLTLALFRLIEAAEGRIEVDGVNIAELGLHKLRSALTIIPQDPVLFAGTLRANVDPFSKYSDEEIWTALEHAHLKSFVKGLPAGLQHEITEGGQNLSVGQKQLICLARALLRKTKILILDEATAAIDLETDDLIQKTIRTEFEHCTVLTIAHRLNTIMDSNRIMVLDKGKVVEFDTPQALLDNKDSVFSSLHKDAAMS